MTDALRCNGCGEYYDREFEFVNVEMDSGVVEYADFTLDDIPTAAFGLLEDDGEGDFCPDCGLKLLRELVSLFEYGDQDA